MEALTEANRIRSHRARLKRELAVGRTTIWAMAADPDCASMRVMDVLLAMPKVGRVKANRALTAARISPSKTLAGITERQRGELGARLPHLPR